MSDERILHGQPWSSYLDHPSGEAADAVDDLTDEQVYQRSLDCGLPRDLAVERILDLSKIGR